MLEPASGMVQTSPEQLSLYWSDIDFPVGEYLLRRGTIRTDGVVSVHAPGDAGARHR